MPTTKLKLTVDGETKVIFYSEEKWYLDEIIDEWQMKYRQHGGEVCIDISNDNEEWDVAGVGIYYEGQIKTLKEWSVSLGINGMTLRTRLKQWSVKEALTKKVNGSVRAKITKERKELN